MDKLKNVPEIRFKGFDDEWIRVFVDEVCDVSNGNMDTQDADASGIYPFFIRSEEVMKSNKYLYDEEAILTPGEGKIGEIFHYVNGKYAAHQRVYRLFNFSKCISPTFLIYTLKNSFKNHALKNSSTATAPSIRKGTITDFCFKTCLLEEQTQIGNFFKNIDEKLELEKEKHEKLKSFKKAMLEDMFPKEGEKVPKVRFEGFEDEWDYLQLSDLGEVSSSGVDKKFYPNEKTVHLLNYMDVYNKKQPSKDNIYEFMKTSADEHKLLAKSVIKGDVFFTPTSETSDDIGHSMAIYNTIDSLVYSYHLLRFRPFDNVLDVSFSNFFANIKPVRKQLITNCQGAQRMTLKLEEFEKLMVSLPSIEEQSLIGNFFKNLDEKIALSEKKIAKIENFKKAMLEKMFV